MNKGKGKNSSIGLGIIDEDSLNIFTDGSSKPLQQRIAGIGVRLVWVNESGDEETEDYFPPGWQSATIDEMEIKACTEGLRYAKKIFPDFSRFKKIILFCDSRYVVDNFVKAINIWPNRKWRGANDMPVANIDLWKELRKEVKNSGKRVDIEWVKAHKRNRHNNMADQLADQSVLGPIQKPLSVSETTRRWSPRKTKPGCIPMEGQTTKIRIIGWEYVNKGKINRYRYEIIDPDDKNFQDVDFIFCKTPLSRNKCFEVQFNSDKSKPTIVEIITELDPSDYKY